jgi:hypothetical protein
MLGLFSGLTSQGLGGGMLGGGGGLLGIAGNPFISAVAQDDDLRDTLFDMLRRRNPVGLTNEMLMPSSVVQSPVGIFNQGTML